MTGRTYRAFATALAALVLAACGGSSPTTATSSPGTPFSVLNVDALSGPLSTTAVACTTGMQAAALALNKTGGILGHPVTIQNFDDQGNPTQANSLLSQALTSGTTWNMAISGGTSDENLAEMPGLNSAKIINISNASSTLLYDPTKNPYHFGISTSSDLTAHFLVNYVQQQNFKKVGLFTYDGAYGQSENASISKWLKAANIPFVNMTFSSTAIDLSPQLLQLKDTGVDAVVWSDLGAQIGYTIKSRAKIGWNIPFIGDLGVSSSDNYTLAGDPANLNNMVIQQFAVDVYKPLTSQSATFQTFWSNLQSVAVTISQPLHLYVTCYDILQAFNFAAKQLNTLNSDKIKALWESGWTPPAGGLVWATKGWGWTAASHAPVNTADQFSIIKIGKLVQGQVQPS